MVKWALLFAGWCPPEKFRDETSHLERESKRAKSSSSCFLVHFASCLPTPATKLHGWNSTSPLVGHHLSDEPSISSQQPDVLPEHSGEPPRLPPPPSARHSRGLPLPWVFFPSMYIYLCVFILGVTICVLMCVVINCVWVCNNNMCVVFNYVKACVCAL